MWQNLMLLYTWEKAIHHEPNKQQQSIIENNQKIAEIENL